MCCSIVIGDGEGQYGLHSQMGKPQAWARLVNENNEMRQNRKEQYKILVLMRQDGF